MRVREIILLQQTDNPHPPCLISLKSSRNYVEQSRKILFSHHSFVSAVCYFWWWRSGSNKWVPAPHPLVSCDAAALIAADSFLMTAALIATNAWFDHRRLLHTTNSRCLGWSLWDAVFNKQPMLSLITERYCFLTAADAWSLNKFFWLSWADILLTNGEFEYVTIQWV